MTAQRGRGHIAGDRSVAVADTATGGQIESPTRGGVGVAIAPAPSIADLGVVASPSRRGSVMRFFAGVVLSMYGDWLTTVALVVVLFEVTGSPLGPAGYVLARVAPRVAGPWLGGRLTDRFSARRLATATAGVQAACTVSLIWSHRSGVVWAIYAAVAAAQFAGGVGRPAQASLIPELVRSPSLARANAAYSLMMGTSIFVAPALGALVLPATGPDLLFAIDALSFVVCAVLLLTLPRRAITQRQSVVSAEVSPGRNAVSAVSAVMHDPTIRMVATANFATGVAATVTQAVLVVAAHERFHGDASVGFLYAAVGVGCTLGGILVFRWTPSARRVRTAVGLGIGVSLLALAGFGSVSWLLPALALLTASSLCETAFDVWGTTAVQQRAPAGHMGRYNSLLFTSLYAGMLLGALWALAALQFWHWDRVVEAACLAMVVVVAVVWVTGRGQRVSLRGVPVRRATDLAGRVAAMAAASRPDGAQGGN